MDGPASNAETGRRARTAADSAALVRELALLRVLLLRRVLGLRETLRLRGVRRLGTLLREPLGRRLLRVARLGALLLALLLLRLQADGVLLRDPVLDPAERALRGVLHADREERDEEEGELRDRLAHRVRGGVAAPAAQEGRHRQHVDPRPPAPDQHRYFFLPGLPFAAQPRTPARRRVAVSPNSGTRL